MTEMIRYLVFKLIGLALAVFGIYSAVKTYPAPGEFAAWTKAMPMLGAMLAFCLSIAAVVVGLAMLMPALWRLRRRQVRSASFIAVNTYARVPAPRLVPVPHVSEYDPQPSGHGGDGYYGGNGGNRVGTGSGYFDDGGERFRGDGEHGEFDDQRRPNTFQ